MSEVVQEIKVDELTDEERANYAPDMLPERPNKPLWKVWDGSHIFCICVSQEHAGAVKVSLQRSKILKRDVERKSFEYKVMDGRIVQARAPDEEIRLIAQRAFERLPTFSKDS